MDAMDMIKNMTRGEDMSYESLLDFNTAEISKPKTLPIPHGTIANGIVNIKAGGDENDPYLEKMMFLAQDEFSQMTILKEPKLPEKESK